VEQKEKHLDFNYLITMPNVEVKKNKVQVLPVERDVHYRFRFLKEPAGVLPTIILNLLDARQNVRNNIKDLQRKASKLSGADKDNILLYINILNQRQLSYKVSANSMYGALGVRRGTLPLMPAAMCVTAKGRESLHKAAHHLMNRYNAKWIYSDTDSTYVQFPFLNKTELWSFARKVESEMLSEIVFPKPMMLEFENAVYDPFMILTRKRYLWKKYKEDGTWTTKIENKGVALARRGTSKFLKDVYQQVVQMIFQYASQNEIQNMIIEQLNLCCSYSLPIEAFIITKRIHDSDSYEVQPAHSLLAEVMQSRGSRVDVGERLEYVVVKKTTKNLCKTKQIKVQGNIEHIEYQKKYGSLLHINHLYYVHLIMNQIDELLEVTFNENKFVETQFKLRMIKVKVLDELMFYFKPVITFTTEVLEQNNI
jgi:DNA polymerase elongation subunit (family B)